MISTAQPTAKTLTFRPHQRTTIDGIRIAWHQGIANVLAVVATGGGKTHIFLGLIDEILKDEPSARFLIIAHRKELIEQPAERIAEFWPHRLLDVGIVMADQNDLERRITIATVQTLQSAHRLAGILAHGPIDYLIIDECHHANAQSYLTIIDALRVANPSLRHLGVTATPLRSDDGGLPYDKKVAHFGVKELVRDGYLAPPRWLAIQTGISLAQVPMVYGGANGADFNQRQLVNVFETDNCFDLVAESHKKYADGRKALAFVVSVEGAYRLAETFNKAGIAAAAADGTTDKEARRGILNDFRNGRYQVLVNMALWTEGLDLPEVSCIHQVRPTKSDALYMQMVGRALRLFPGKDDALVLDYAPAEARNVTMMGDVLGVKVRKDVYIQDKVEEGEVVAGFTFDRNGLNWLQGNPMEIVSRQLDYMSATPWRWHHIGQGDWLTLGLGPGEDGTDRTLAISPPGTEMHLWGVARGAEERWARAYHLSTGTFEEIQLIAEEYCLKWGNETLAFKAARWRKEAPTEGQLKFAKRLGLDVFGKTRGQLAADITHKLAVQALKRAGAA